MYLSVLYISSLSLLTASKPDNFSPNVNCFKLTLNAPLLVVRIPVSLLTMQKFCPCAFWSNPSSILFTIWLFSKFILTRKGLFLLTIYI